MEEQFSMLHDYIAELKRTNPGTIVVIRGAEGDIIDSLGFTYAFMH